jgi:hypothetical protein
MMFMALCYLMAIVIFLFYPVEFLPQSLAMADNTDEYAL